MSDSIRAWYETEYDVKNVVTVLNTPPKLKIKKKFLLHEASKLSREKKIIIYVGGLISGRGIEGLLSVFPEMEQDEYVLVFMGYGHLENQNFEPPGYRSENFSHAGSQT